MRIARAAVVLPSSPPHDVAHLDAGIAWLVANGVAANPPVSRAEADPEAAHLAHLAGPDHLRAQELCGALAEAPVDAVWCGRGGSGALRTLDAIDAQHRWAARTAAQGTPKIVADERNAQFSGGSTLRPELPLVGLSDATALLLWRAFGPVPGVAVHGPVVTQLPHLDDASADALRTWLRDPNVLPTLRADCLDGIGGTAHGELAGGNLSLLASVVGTPQAVRCEGRILFFEEVAEPAYRIDRLLSQLQRSGGLRGVKGVVVGTFTNCPAPASVARCLADWAQRLGVPWAGTFPIGHGPQCRPVGLGVRYQLDADRGLLRPTETLMQAHRRRSVVDV